MADATAQQAFISAVAPGAVATQRRYGIPAPVTIAQAILESGWGQSDLATRGHNLFGIKGMGPAGTVQQQSQEYLNGHWVTQPASFRVYHNVTESIGDHGKLLATSGYYQEAMSVRGNPNAFAAALTGVYATDPQYGAKLIHLMQRYNLYRYDAAASGTPHAASTPGTPTPGTPTPGTHTPGTPTPGTAAPNRAAPGAAIAGAATAGKATPAAALLGAAAIPGLQDAPPAPLGTGPKRAASPHAVRGVGRRPRPLRAASPAKLSAQTVSAVRVSLPLGHHPRRVASRTASANVSPYQHHMPASVKNAFVAMAKRPLTRAETLYRDVAGNAGIRWELLAACDWMQCEARARYSPVHGERLGAENPDGTVYRTKSAALEQCAFDLADLAQAVYGIELTPAAGLSVTELANVFAAFRWGGLLKLHHTSAMEFPYSVAGLTTQHTRMRWPNIDHPLTPDKPGGRFHMPFGAVPVVLSLHYPATA